METEKLDYDAYKHLQTQRSSTKWGFTKRYKDIQIRAEIEEALFRDAATKKLDNIVCMGIRSGNEFFVFKKIIEAGNIIGARVFGVDINEKVYEVDDDCYCFDFAHLPERWKDKFDLLYSNSLDHALDVDETLKEWDRVVKKGGMMILRLSKAEPTAVDLHKFNEGDLERFKKIGEVDKYTEEESSFTIRIKK